MANTCGHCGTRISCGCQKRTATDGKQVCTKCVVKYNAKLKGQELIKQIK